MGKKKILVDDEPAVRLLVRRLLSKDYIILEAEDGLEAINVASTQKPDLILLDILMPGIDGMNALGVIKRNRATKEIPVVMLTGLHYGLNKKLCQELGADSYITKPFSLQDLLDVIGRCLLSPR
jgi:two-component system alkaline phosphatase synthesis response regulator PhoP